MDHQLNPYPDQLSDVSGAPINPATEEKQDAIIAATGRGLNIPTFDYASQTQAATKMVGTTSIKVGTAGGYLSSDGSAGATGTFTTVDGKTCTVKDGLITSIV